MLMFIALRAINPRPPPPPPPPSSPPPPLARPCDGRRVRFEVTVNTPRRQPRAALTFPSFYPSFFVFSFFFSSLPSRPPPSLHPYPPPHLHPGWFLLSGFWTSRGPLPEESKP